MPTNPNHAGSGIDKPDPKGILEKLGDGIKAVLPKKAEDDTPPAPAESPKG